MRVVTPNGLRIAEGHLEIAAALEEAEVLVTEGATAEASEVAEEGVDSVIGDVEAGGAEVDLEIEVDLVTEVEEGGVALEAAEGALVGGIAGVTTIAKEAVEEDAEGVAVDLVGVEGLVEIVEVGVGSRNEIPSEPQVETRKSHLTIGESTN